MFSAKINNSEYVVVGSHYDSGRFLGVKIAIQREGDFFPSKSLDDVLTKEEIQELEVTLLLEAKRLLKGKEE